MRTIERRLRRLEAEAAGAGRMFVVFSHGASDEAVTLMLAERGERVGPADQLVHFETIYEDRDGKPIPNTTPPVLSSIIPARRFGLRRH